MCPCLRSLWVTTLYSIYIAMTVAFVPNIIINIKVIQQQQHQQQKIYPHNIRIYKLMMVNKIYKVKQGFLFSIWNIVWINMWIEYKLRVKSKRKKNGWQMKKKKKKVFSHVSNISFLARTLDIHPKCNFEWTVCFVRYCCFCCCPYGWDRWMLANRNQTKKAWTIYQGCNIDEHDER